MAFELSDNHVKSFDFEKQIQRIQSGETNRMDLRGLKFSTFKKWESIFELEQIEYLDLSETEIPKDVLAKNISNLSNLRYLFLNGFSADQIPDEVAELPQLELLNVTGFQNLPEWILDCTSLKSLCISPQAISTMPVKFPDLTGIELVSINSSTEGKLIVKGSEIYMPGRFSSRYPNFKEEPFILNLKKFNKLKKLDLTGMKIRQIFESISHFDLEELFLTNNQLKAFPKEILSQKKLRKLDLVNNFLEHLPQGLEELTQLEHLEIQNNNIAEIGDRIANLKNLKTLILAKNKIKYISEGISELENLRVLVLKYNDLTEIPEFILDCKSLGQGSLDYPYESRPLFQTDFRDNPIENVPQEVVNRGFGAIKNYFQAIKEGKVTSFLSSKLMIVGRGGVGKTSLMKKIINPDFDINEKREGSTKGIDIRKWNFKLGGEEDFEARIWDFGGQQHYRARHQFFLTKRSLYVLVWDARQEEDYLSFDYWLSMVKLFSNDSPVIVVMNKLDERNKSINEKAYKDSFPNILSFHKVSCQDGRGIEDLRREIQGALIQLPHVENKLPITWKYIRDELEGKKENFVSSGEYFRLCRLRGLIKEKASHLSNYLHDLGTILHYQNHPSLLNTVILNPEWLTKAVYALVDDKKIIQSHGNFVVNDLERIWGPLGYPVDKFGTLVELMQRVEFCFTYGAEGNYLIPELLSPETPVIQWKSLDDRLFFEYHYVFMPVGIMTKFIVRNRKNLADEDLLWKHGVFLKRKDTEAFMLEDPLKSRITIQICGTGDRKWHLAWITQELENIHSEYHQLEVKRRIPCVCKECQKSEKPYFFDYDRLGKAKRKGKITVECQESFEDVVLEELLLGFENDEESNTRNLSSDTTTRSSWGQVKRGLRKLFINYYNELNDISRIAGDAGIPLKNVTLGKDINFSWNEVIEEGRKQGKIQDLINLVIEEYPLSEEGFKELSGEWTV